jgi:flagellar hook-length control protein FliK
MAVATSTNSGLEVIDRPHMPAAPERTVPLRPLSRSEFADAVLRFAAFEVELPEKGGVSRMRLEVTPADLGHLDIEVRHEGDAIDVRITATDPSAVTTLRESEHIIRDLLSREEGGRVTVSIDVAAKDGSGGEGRGQRRGTEHQRSEGSEPETKLLKVRLRDSNQFDVYV